MKIAIIDFEATGKEPEKDRITEVAVHVIQPEKHEDGTYMGLSSLSEFHTLVYEHDYPEITPEVEAVTGISQALVKTAPFDFEGMVTSMRTCFYQAGGPPDYFLAHNAKFDSTLFKSEMKRHKDILVKAFGEESMRDLFAIPWLCSIEDIEHPPKMTCKKLSHLALDYGVNVDPTKLHRAWGDVALLTELLLHIHVDFDKVITRFKEPWIYVRAMVPKPYGKGGDGGKGKETAKAQGYGWQKAPRTDGPQFEEAWVKRIKESELETEKGKLSEYEVRIVARG